jgi:plastocyanin
MKKVLMFALVAVMSLGLLTACGGGPAAGAGGKEYTVEMGPGFKFTPATLDLTKGEKVTVKLVNKDTAQAHTFIIKDLNVKSKSIAANASDSVSFTPDKTGPFEIVCDIAGHKEGGMHGTATVK